MNLFAGILDINTDLALSNAAAAGINSIINSNNISRNHKHEGSSTTSVKSHSSFKRMSTFLKTRKIALPSFSTNQVNVEDEAVDDDSSDGVVEAPESAEVKQNRLSYKSTGSSQLAEHISEVEKLCDIFMARSEVQQLQVQEFQFHIDCCLLSEFLEGLLQRGH